MKKSIWDVRIPSIAAFLLLIIGIGITVFLVRDRITLTGRASVDTEPQGITISNITDTSFTVSYLTKDKSDGAVALKKTTDLNTLFTDSQENAAEKEFTSHFIVVENLSPETDYSFAVISNGTEYIDGSNPFVVSTGSVLTQENANEITASGRILLPNGENAVSTLVYLQSNNSQILSAVTDASGAFTIPLSILRTSLLNNYQVLSPNDILSLKAYTQNFASTVSLLYQNAAVIPPFTISENYDFTNSEEAQVTATTSALPVPSIGLSSVTSVTISSPRANQSLIDLRPVIRGTAAPNQMADISIQPEGITADVPVSASGAWSYRPPEALTQGSHTVTLLAKDSGGITRTLSVTFLVLPSGSQIAQAATPSATVTRAPTVTASPTTALSPTLTLTLTLTPTGIASTSPTFTPSPTIALTATLSPTIPIKVIPTVAQPGAQSSLILTGISLFFIVTGAVLFFIIG